MGEDGPEHSLILLLALLAAETARTTALGQAIDAATACPRGNANEIVVCRRQAPSERYRLPEIFRKQGFDFFQEEVDGVSRERNRLMEGGEGGIGSCSASGAAGASGCLLKKFRAGEQQRAGHH